MGDDTDYRAKYEEERRARQEAERRGQEAERRGQEAETQRQEAETQRQEAERQRQEAELEAEKARQEARQTTTFNQLLREELQRNQNLVAHNQDLVDLQSLETYLAQISRLQSHAARLLPRPTHRQLSHTQLQSAEPSRSSPRPSGSQPTTSGRTDIVKKYYPLRLRLWTGFPDTVERGFAAIQARLRDEAQHGLPSRHSVQDDEKNLLERLPIQALMLDGALNAKRTNTFLTMALLTPTSRILNQYLKQGASGSVEKVFFDADIERVADVSSSTGSAGSSPRSAGSSAALTRRKAQPDCAVLAMGTNEAAGDDGPAPSTEPARLIAVGEHKPCHALRASSVSQILRRQLSEDFVVRLARQALERQEKKNATLTEAASAVSAASAAPAAAAAAGPAPGSGPRPEARTSKVDKQTYFAYALAQTYHYMLVSGVEYGYIATGEILAFLRILEDDPGTLYYHVSSFPIASPPDEGELQPSAAETPVSRSTSDVDEEALAKLPIAQLAGFCELALRTPLRPSAWVVGATQGLATFPRLPQSIAARYQRPPSVLGRRRRDDDDDDDNDDGDDSDDSGGSGPSSRGQLRPPLSSSRARAPSPLQRELPLGRGRRQAAVDIATSFLSTPSDLSSRRPSRQVLKPTRDYCTQACLLGLVQGRPLDKQCPNYADHQAASTRSDCGDRHAITQLELAQKIRDQLFDTPEVNCQYFINRRGAIGFPFKLTLTGYGYTLVGKGVEDDFRRRLVHESRIYQGLLPLQGSLIPVHLGLIRLHVAYPLTTLFRLLPFMMLMSYVGESTASIDAAALAQAGTDLAAETWRTTQELAEWGVDDEDDNVSNVRWCAEMGRVMRIDFDRALLLRTRNHSQTASSAAPTTPATPGTLNAADADATDPDSERPSKRTRLGEDGLAVVDLGVEMAG